MFWLQLIEKGGRAVLLIEETEASKRFQETYEMKPPGPRPSWVEPGSMDASDWDITEGEYDQFPQEREEMLDYLERELDGLYNEEFTIHDYRSRLKEGDRILIVELASREKGRIDIGESVGFDLKDGGIYRWYKGKTERSYQWGYPEEHSVQGQEETFGQEDFDKAMNIISELYAGLEALSSK